MAKSNQDTMTLQLIKEVKKQKEEISNAERPNWLTNCALSVLGRNINLHVETSIPTLIEAAALLIHKEEIYNVAAFRLGADVPPYLYDGYSVSDWLSDIKSRIDKISIQNKRRKLEVLENRLSSIVSPELRAKLELEAISKELGADL